MILAANKKTKNLKDLLIRSDPYRVTPRNDEDSQGYIPCGNNCDSCNNFVIPCKEFVSFADGRTFKARGTFSCKLKFVVYLAFCIKCKKQGIGSTFEWKPRLSNYKSHINNKHYTCHIVRHFIDVCCGDALNIRFSIIDSVNNVYGLSTEEIDDILLKKRTILDWDFGHTT